MVEGSRIDAVSRGVSRTSVRLLGSTRVAARVGQLRVAVGVFNAAHSFLGLSGVGAADQVYRMTVLSFRRRASSSDDAGAPEQLELLGRIAAFGADFVGVLAEQLRANNVDRGVRQPQR